VWGGSALATPSSIHDLLPTSLHPALCSSRHSFTPIFEGALATRHFSSANSFPGILLQTLCRRTKSQLLCNQANPRSLGKTPGVGYSSQGLHHTRLDLDGHGPYPFRPLLGFSPGIVL
jgi:hypothetical protein